MKRAPSWARSYPSPVCKITNDSAADATLTVYGFIGDDPFEPGVTDTQVMAELDKLRDKQRIRVRLNSPGGSVFQGIAIHNALLRHPATIEVSVDALAASIASVIAMAGRRIIMQPGSTMMIHDPHMIVLGDADDMRKGAEVLDKMKDNLIDIYARRTKLSRAKLSTLMTAETWMGADDAVKQGFATTTGDSTQSQQSVAAKLRTMKLDGDAARYAHLGGSAARR
jgi:ATP-dependent protease ClpP protease subunit